MALLHVGWLPSCQSLSHAPGRDPSLPMKRNTRKTQGECAVPGNGRGPCRKRLWLVAPAPWELPLAGEGG